ncbi:hypothetical protein [Hirschia litorea]|uniref:Uncharacterized protein n=1 Tax=Hirschia litorea TaxID=1199156 RepID=A0ABW2IJV5_9PROT
MKIFDTKFTSKWMKLNTRMILSASILTSVGCKTVSESVQIAPPLPPAVEVKPAPPPVEPEEDLSLGPKVATAPVARVDEKPIPPAQTGIKSGSAVVVAKQFPEPNDLAGVTQAHSYALQARGARGVEWSSALSQRAQLQVRQLPEGMCSFSESKVFSASGEAIFISPAGKDSKGQSRLLNISPKVFVENLIALKAGPFGRDDAGASQLGCDIKKCENNSQIWLCRYQ